MNTAERIYSTGNKTYAKSRPRYPEQLFQKIFSKVRERKLAVDVGTGTGQTLEPLIRSFNNVIAVDRSPEQMAEATQSPKVRFVVAPAERLIEDTRLAASSVDLITVGSALHWFDLDKFYSQCRTVLKPGGCLAAFAYYLWSYPNNPAANAALLELHDEFLGPYTAPTVNHVRNKYKDLLPSKTHFKDLEMLSASTKVKMSVARCAGFMSTLSGYKQYRATHSDAPDPLDHFCEKTLSALGIQDLEEEFEVDWEFFGFIATNTD